MKSFDDVILRVHEMFKYHTISHCDKCHHEAHTILGNKCGWCGGNMVEEEKK